MNIVQLWTLIYAEKTINVRDFIFLTIMTRSVLRIFSTLFEFKRAARSFDVTLLLEQSVTFDCKKLRGIN